MSKMSFLPQLKGFLLTHGVIYTVRKFNMPTSRVHIEDVGDARREHMKEIKTREELEPYVALSGFESLPEWWTKIKYFIPMNGPYYLYKVTLQGEK